MARTDGNHSTITRDAALSQSFHCRDCGGTVAAGDVMIWDRQTGGGSALQRLSDRADYDPVGEDELRCVCESSDLVLLE